MSFRDPETAKYLVFLTNRFDLPALTIAQIYKNRWQIELDQLVTNALSNIDDHDGDNQLNLF